MVEAMKATLDLSSARRLVRGAHDLAGEPEPVRRFYRYWDARRGDRAMPARGDIDPADMKEFLPDLLLIDVEEGDGKTMPRFRYRVVGTREVHLRGFDPTGLHVENGYFGPSVEDALGCYSTVYLECCPLYDPLPFITPDNRWRHEDTLFLPLSEQPKDVSQILVFAHKRESDAESR